MKRRPLAIGAVLLLGAAGTLLLVRSRSPRPTGETPSAAAGERAGSSARRAAAAGRPASTSAPAEAPGSPPRKENYLARYNGLSGQLPADSALRKNIGAVDLEGRGAVPLSLHVDKTFVVQGEALHMRAVLGEREDQEPVALKVHVIPLRAPSHSFVREMQIDPADAKAFTATIDTRDAQLAAAVSSIPGPLDVEYFVDVSAKSDDMSSEPQKPRAATSVGTFVVARPGAALAPGTTAHREGSDLVLDLGFTVSQHGRYWIYAELWGGQDGEIPIAFGRRQLGELGTGYQSQTLLFGGRIIRDRGVDGPFVIRNVTVARVDTVPPHVAPRIDQTPPTPAWAATEFGQGT
jgi:hypothetical protein